VGKVDRAGNLLLRAGLTPMQAAVVMAGGRVPETADDETESMLGGRDDDTLTPLTAPAVGIASMPATRRFLAGAGSALGSSSSSVAPSMHGGSVSAASQRPGGAIVHEDLYTFIDEEYLHRLSVDMQWERDNGIIHLMPIAVVYQSDVY
jgi:hypothetical protein